MEVIIQPAAKQVCEFGARRVAHLIRSKPTAVLGLPTGNTPIALYAELVRLHRQEGLSFKQVVTFNLDEYIGLPPSNPASYHAFMRQHLFDHVDLDPSNVHVPDGMATDVPETCRAYEKAIRDAGGVDLQLLGIGADGHIGFNEPSSSLASRTRLKTLTDKTMRFNKSFFGAGQTVPRYVITMGVGTIMEARECLLLAFGDSKAPAVERMVEGPVSAMLPASMLQMHPRTVAVLDEAAAKNLRHKDYYRFVFNHKPAWQRHE